MSKPILTPSPNKDIKSRINGHARTRTAQQRLAQEYGVSVDQIGNLSPEQVRASALKAKALKQQEKLAAAYAKNSGNIESSLNQLEQVRAQMLADGSTALQASDKLLGDAIRTNAALESSMKLQAAKLAGDLSIEQQKNQQALQQYQQTLQGQLQTMAATHDAQLALIGYTASQNQLQGVAGVKDGYQAAKDNAQYNRDFNNYINGNDKPMRFRLPTLSAKGLFS